MAFSFGETSLDLEDNVVFLYHAGDTAKFHDVTKHLILFIEELILIDLYAIESFCEFLLHI